MELVKVGWVGEIGGVWAAWMSDKATADRIDVYLTILALVARN